jgi:hypothetical protein
MRLTKVCWLPVVDANHVETSASQPVWTWFEHTFLVRTLESRRTECRAARSSLLCRTRYESVRAEPTRVKSRRNLDGYPKPPEMARTLRAGQCGYRSKPRWCSVSSASCHANQAYPRQRQRNDRGDGQRCCLPDPFRRRRDNGFRTSKPSLSPPSTPYGRMRIRTTWCYPDS